MRRPFRRRLAIMVAVVGLLGWYIGFMPGRIWWLHLSFPSAALISSEAAYVPVPSKADDRTTWSLETRVGSAAGTHEYRLLVQRWLSNTEGQPGDQLLIEGRLYTFVEVRQLFGQTTVVLHARQRPRDEAWLDELDWPLFPLAPWTWVVLIGDVPAFALLLLLRQQHLAQCARLRGNASLQNRHQQSAGCTANSSKYPLR